MPEFVGTLRTPRLAGAPTSPTPGEMYYNTSANILYWWDGTAWIDASGGGGWEVVQVDATPFELQPGQYAVADAGASVLNLPTNPSKGTQITVATDYPTVTIRHPTRADGIWNGVAQWFQTMTLTPGMVVVLVYGAFDEYWVPTTFGHIGAGRWKFNRAMTSPITMQPWQYLIADTGASVVNLPESPLEGTQIAVAGYRSDITLNDTERSDGIWLPHQSPETFQGFIPVQKGEVVILVYGAWDGYWVPVGLTAAPAIFVGSQEPDPTYSLWVRPG